MNSMMMGGAPKKAIEKPLNKMKKDELIAVAKSENVDASGTVKELIALIEEARKPFEE